jgi:hypothetical protein
MLVSLKLNEILNVKTRELIFDDPVLIGPTGISLV